MPAASTRRTPSGGIRALPALFALATIALVAGLAASAAHAAPPDADTAMYEGGKRIGWLNTGEFADPLALSVSCEGGTGYNGGSVVINPRRTWIYVNLVSDRHAGFARLVKPGRWAIYFVGKGRSYVGFAKQRTTLRWNVYDRRSRRVGYTLGPDGPQAAAVLMTLC